MRDRLYFLLPDVKHAQSTMRHLLLARIEERHVHVLAKDGTDIKDLPPATLGQKSDFYHAMALGIIVGGITGIAGGMTVYLFPPEGMNITLSVVALFAMLGSIFGVWTSGLIGTDVPNTQLARFHRPIEKGKILMMVDVPRDKVGEIRSIMKKQHPEASDNGVDAMYPVFP
ncbi:MAG: hypothetical protein LJE56_10540 [Acidiferrobacterales bacterium]|jgi:hypothetical protein|nr:hypothetical protein [Acidiferrobacterales bacterium]